MACLDRIELYQHGKPLGLRDAYELLAAKRDNFASRFATYCLLRQKGFVVHSGINYGTDFVLYRKDPDLVHAEHSVVVLDADDRNFTWRTAVGINRSCASAKKTLLIASVKKNPSSKNEEDALESFVKDYDIQLVKMTRWIPEESRQQAQGDK